MYDMAKRSLAFTVATGGLLLTGTGFAPAEAAVGSGTSSGPATAQGNASAQHGSQSVDSTPISVAGPNNAKAAQGLLGALIPVALDGQTVHERPDAQKAQNAPVARGVENNSPQNAPARREQPGVLNAPDPGPGSSAQGAVSNSGGVLSGNSIEVPITLPVNLCGDQVNVAALLNENSGAACEIGTGPAGGGQASAGAKTTGSGGIASGNQIQIPVSAPINVCGNQINVLGVENVNGPSQCGINEGGAPPPSPVGTPLPTTTPPVGNTPPPSTPPSCGSSAPAATAAPLRAPLMAAPRTCSPPPTTTPPVGNPPPPSTTPPVGNTPPPSTPPSCGSSAPAATAAPLDAPAQSGPCTPPPGSGTPPATTPPGGGAPAPGGDLASTGTEEGGVLAAAGAALLAGVGLRTASKRGRRSR